jgi:hypothetical protein
VAALGTLQSVTAIADSIQLCYQGYCYASEFIHSMREMGEDIAELEQRYREEEFRMWAFALGHNLVIDEKHSRNAEYLNNLPPYWVSTVHQRFLQATKHMKDVEKIVDRYVSKKAPSLQQPISNNGRGSTFHPKIEPLEKSANLIAARSSSEKHIVFLQKSSFQVKVCWSLHDKKKLYDIIRRLERDNDMLWNMTEPSLLISMCDAVSSKMSFTDLETFAVRTSSKIDSQDAAQKQEYECRVKEQGQARNYIAGLDKESKDQKLSRRIDLSCFQEILNAKLPDPRTRAPLRIRSAVTKLRCSLNGKSGTRILSQGTMSLLESVTS